MNKNKYEVLGLTRDALPKDIKKKFVELSLQYHPDKNYGDSEEIIQIKQKKFQEISAAYATLSDLDEKQSYDLTLPRRSYVSQERRTSTAPTYPQTNAFNFNSNAQGSGSQKSSGASYSSTSDT